MTLTQAQDKSIFRYNALVAQSVECILGKDEVSSSILLKGSTKSKVTVPAVTFFARIFRAYRRLSTKEGSPPKKALHQRRGQAHFPGHFLLPVPTPAPPIFGCISLILPSSPQKDVGRQPARFRGGRQLARGNHDCCRVICATLPAPTPFYADFFSFALRRGFRLLMSTPATTSAPPTKPRKGKRSPAMRPKMAAHTGSPA